uniref:Uncharacterized protein n=1 Tax=Candidatus Kentrum sp. DK TaxID=2126562 RepID=A0A450SQ55_9GAMM|nr:MAG: hypothetical protein BECKDK2373B_GA0170837_105615 [Candidatus Kentron sp. DK]
MALQDNSRVIFYKKRVRIKTTFFFSALLCELCASAVAIFSFLTAEAQSSQRSAEKKEKEFMDYRFPDVHGKKTRPADLSTLFPDEPEFFR